MHLVFDFGKVVFDWDPRQLLMRLLPHHAPDPAAAASFEARFFQGFRGDWGEFDRGTLDAATLARRIADRTGLSPAEARAVIDAVPEALHPLPAMRALLDRLHASDHASYFLSNMPRPYADALEAAHPFLAGFAVGIYSGRAGAIKPEPAIFALAERQFGVAPSDLLLIDDVHDNVAAAQAAGWQALRFESVAQCERAIGHFGFV